jgi:hypothetical protein
MAIGAAMEPRAHTALGTRPEPDASTQTITRFAIMVAVASLCANAGPNSKIFWLTWANARQVARLIAGRTHLEITSLEIADGLLGSSKA